MFFDAKLLNVNFWRIFAGVLGLGIGLEGTLYVKASTADQDTSFKSAESNNVSKEEQTQSAATQAATGESSENKDFLKSKDLDKNDKSATPDLSAISYDVEYKGLASEVVLKEFEQRSLLKTFKDHKLYSRYALEKRTNEDLVILNKLYFAYGYYEAKVRASYTKKGNKTEVQLIADEGPRYKVGDLKVFFTQENQQTPKPCTPAFTSLGVACDDQIDSKKILDAYQKILVHLATCGYPYGKIGRHEAYVNTKKKTVSLRLMIKLGPFVRYGKIRLKNESNVSNGYIENRAPFKEGDVFDQQQLDEYRERLSSAGLFKAIIINDDQKALQEGEVPIDVLVRSAKQRSITAGAKYSFSEGIAVTSGWTHRNFTGRGDKLSLTGELGTKIRKLELEYELPDFLMVNQTLITSLNWNREKTESYDSHGYGAAALLKYQMQKNLSLSYGLSYDSSKVTKEGQLYTSDVIGVPLGLEVSNVNNRLNPATGGLFRVDLTPEFGKIGEAKKLLRLLTYGTYHIPFDSKKYKVLALWARFGSLLGDRLDDISPDRRFYMGGGGSIRGYGYQLAGPLDQSSKPIGGKSKMVFGVEPRFRINETWGGVVFFEGGSLSQKSHPKFSDHFFFGYGAGVRYYTGFGPIRFDLAFPSRRRKDTSGKWVDRPFQIYISIGQAF